MENEEQKKQIVNIPKNKYRKKIVIVFFILALLVFYVNYRGEYLETLELGQQYLNIFWKDFSYTLITFGIIFIITFFLVCFTNLRIKKGLSLFFEKEKKPIPKLPNKSICFIIAVVLSVLLTNILLEKFLLCINSTGFGINDPSLNLDIGYFIFVQPFIQIILKYILYAIIALTIYAVLYYIIAFNKYFDGIDRDILKNGYLTKQLCTNIIFIALIVSIIVYVETFNVGLQKIITLQDSSYVLWGAGISEVTIQMWGYRILSAIIFFSIILAVHYYKNKETKKVIKALLTVPTYLLFMFVVLIGFEIIFVNPNEFDKQQSYVQANIDATKQAYGINIDEINLVENETITQPIIKNNKNVINNIALVNKSIVLDTLNTMQTNKGYYTYRTAKISLLNNDLVYVSPREITDSAGTYNNKTYEYTHGYGVVISSATSLDDSGNVVYFQKDFASNSIAKITQPRIYFGLETNDTVVTNSNNKKEFDYPISSSTKAENAENVYDGKAGLNLNFVDRLILAIKEGDMQLAFSANVSSHSKILVNRNVIERAKTLMPYVMYDENPYLTITDKGRLIWVIDGYTTTVNYPYSQKITLYENDLLNRKQINYIRNSLKVLVDAYDGTIKYYITDRNDPIIMAYQKMYKDLFVTKDEVIPQDISNQFIYPEFLYNIQAEILKRYHNIQTDVLYRGDDVWEIATHNTTKILSKSGTEIEPYYTIIKPSDSNTSVLGLVLPYTPENKQNLTAYLVGNYDNGIAKLKLYKYPYDSNVLGPMQLDTQLEQDETISQEMESLNVAGTKIIKNMMVVPINNSLLYVEPIYQQYINEDNSIPILKKVVVASGNKVAIGNNLNEALNNLVSQYAVDIEVENTDTIEDLIRAIIKANNNLTESNNNNNWEMIGKDMARLQELINKLQILKEEQENNTTEEIETDNTEIINDIINNVVNNSN